MDHCARTTESAHVEMKEEKSTLLRASLSDARAVKREQRNELSLRDIVVRVIKKYRRTGRDVNLAQCNV